MTAIIVGAVGICIITLMNAIMMIKQSRDTAYWTRVHLDATHRLVDRLLAERREWENIANDS